MPSSELITVYTVNDAPAAQIIKNALEAEQIPCVLVGLEQASTAAIPGMMIQIQVPATQAERARELIANHESTSA
jgi:hypothetical protein